MAYRRLTRSSSKTQEQQLPAAPISSANRSRKPKKQEQVAASDPMDDAMDWGLGWEQEAALNPVTDFSDLPACFQSQPTLSQKSASLSFGSELLRASETLPSDAWKISSDPDHELSSPATQLDMVSGIDQVLESSSLLYSPASVAPVPSPESAAAPLTTAEELLQLYLPCASARVPDDDDDEAVISDEALLEDLDDILLSFQSDVPDPEDSLSHIHVGFNPPADTLALAMSSQYEQGLYVVEDQSLSADSDSTTDSEPAPVAAPSRKGKTVVKKETPVKSTTKRGRKRKASSDSDCAEERKRRQNAEAAKNYRKRKAEQMNKVFEEKEEVEKELEKVRKRLSSKMNERNILLKMLYESYRENADSAPHKILFPPWIQTWYQKQCDD